MLQHGPGPPALRAPDNFETTDYNIVWVTVRKAEEWSFVFGLFGSNPYRRVSGAGAAIATCAQIPQKLGKDRVDDAI